MTTPILVGDGIVDRNPLRSLGARSLNFQYGKICIGQITSVNTTSGIVRVRFPFLTEDKNCHIKVEGLFANRFSSSWSRIMPQTGSLVLCGFDHSNNAYILSSSLYFSDNETDNYNNTQKLYKKLSLSKQRGDLHNNDWRILNEGELDARSSGGCYYHMSSDGIYTLSSEKTILQLIRDRNEALFEADLLRSLSTFSTFRFGDVKRFTSSTDINDSLISDNIHNHEFSYRLRGTAPEETLANNIFSYRSGNVFNWSNKEIVSSENDFPVRLKIQSYRGIDSTSRPTFDLEVDSEGNTSINTNSNNTIFSINTGEVSISSDSRFTIDSNGSVSVSTNSDISLSSAGEFSVTSQGPTSIEAPSVALGLAAQSGGVVLGPGLSAALATAAGQFTAQSLELNRSATTLASTLASTAGPPNPGTNLALISQMIAIISQIATSSGVNASALTTLANQANASPVTSGTVTSSL